METQLTFREVTWASTWQNRICLIMHNNYLALLAHIYNLQSWKLAFMESETHRAEEHCIDNACVVFPWGKNCPYLIKNSLNGGSCFHWIWPDYSHEYSQNVNLLCKPFQVHFSCKVLETFHIELLEVSSFCCLGPVKPNPRNSFHHLQCLYPGPFAWHRFELWSSPVCGFFFNTVHFWKYMFSSFMIF